MGRIPAIHQFHPACASGDGVTNGMLFTRRLLMAMGFESEIYCDHIPPVLRNEIRSRNELRPDTTDLLLLHHSLGYRDFQWLSAFAGRCILVYHNITPAELLPAEGPWRELSVLGRQQLRSWRPWFCDAWGDSSLNTEELREAGYSQAQTLPLLVDTTSILQAAWDASVLEGLRDTTNILFVGRLVGNKRQDLLIQAFSEYLHYADRPARLLLAGAATSSDHLTGLQDLARSLDVQNHVKFLGSVSDPVLRGLYRAADLFACCSEHEGFGMPLIEASVFDVPVLARALSGVPGTLGEGGLLTRSEDPAELGVLMHMLLSERGLRRRVLAGQQRNLNRFDTRYLAGQLSRALTQIGFPPPIPDPSHSLASGAGSSTLWRIEGPFDSSYSLAVVNRETARALSLQGQAMSLSITPGTNEPAADARFLRQNPDVAAMAALAGTSAPTDAVLRFTYPPACDAMLGRLRIVHAYGWEETGFPARYVDWFNRKLDLITVLSREVEKTLRDAGVRIPIAVVGAGVDHLDSPSPAAQVDAPLPDARTFRFLHVSSCFPRKGVDVLLQAYGKSFRDSDDVSLIIKTFPNPHNDVAEQLSRWRRRDPGYPDVILIEEDWSQPRIAKLYAHCHAFVAPARGEGLGLPLAEAMRFGLPVITTGWGGQTDFCTSQTAWIVDYRFGPARTHLEVDHSAWAEPDVDHLAVLMKQVRQASPKELQPRVEAARLLISREYTWARMAEKTRIAVRALDSMPLFQKSLRVAWVSSWNTRCGIASYSAYLSSAMAPNALRIYASNDVDRVAVDDANVVRCWTSGLQGNTSDLLARLNNDAPDVVIIQYNYGFFPLSQLAALIDSCKDRNQQVHVFLHATRDVDKPDFKASLRDISSSLSRADRLYVHGYEDLDRLRSFGLAANTTLFVHGIPMPSVPPDASRRAKRGLTGKRVIASYGFLLPHKGQRQLVQAFAKLAAHQQNLHLALICALYPVAESIAEKQHIESMIKHFGLDQRVTLVTDYLSDEDSLSWLQMADCIVFAYQNTQESSSAAVRMGIASGRPVVVTPLSIFDDVDKIVHRLPGCEPEAIAEGLQQLLSDPALLSSRQVAANQHLQSRGWPNVAQRFSNIVHGIAQPNLTTP